ncbi:MAG: epoxyalkane--coenzyme M transferase, partial [Steroidobacteraceae bacterium]
MPGILTTHVGSLPRGDELVPLLRARDRGLPYDAAEFDRLVQAAVDEAVTQQEAAGVSIVSDGELGKVGYSTYVTERLSGFGGNVARKPALDLAALPQLRNKLAVIMGEQEFVRASCVGPVRLVNPEPCREDILRFVNAMKGRSVRGFLNAASPGLITAFQPNAFYPSHEAFLADLVAAMRPEYESIAASGFQLQLDCPDLAMSRHTGFQDASEEEFLKIATANVEALNAATAN